jgi:hypothetical protein
VAVTWNNPTTASTFQLALLQGNEPLPIDPPPSYQGDAASFDMALNSTTAYRIAVSATNGIVSGPLSLVENLIIAKPEITSVIYDNGNILLDWRSISQQAILGYEILLFETGNITPVADSRVASHGGSIPFTLIEGKTYEVQVRGLGSNSAGPLSKPANPNEVGTSYFFSSYNPDVAPYIYRSPVRPPVQAAFELYLPEIFLTPPSDIPSKLDPIGPSPFKLSKVANNNLPYKLSIAADSDAWKFDAGKPPIREELAADYKTFMQELENVAGGLMPGAVPYIRQAISRGLPLTFSETLYYAYGYNPANRYVDLQAGMRVRIDYEMYQFVGPGGKEPLLNGFVGNSTTYYQMDEYLNGLTQSSQVQELGVNSFLSPLPLDVQASNGGAGGMIDFYVNGFRQPYFRIFYPSSFSNTDQPGWVGTSKNIAFVAADSYTDMEAATQQFINGQPFPDQVKSGYFRGRAAIVPEISVSLNGVYVFVPIGTTLRQLLTRQTIVPLRAVVSGQSTLRTGSLTMARSVENVINMPEEIATTYRLDRNNTILFDYKDLITYSNGNDYYDMPLLNGDRISLIN